MCLNTVYAVVKGREEIVLLLFVTFFGRIGVCQIKKDPFDFAVYEALAEPIFLPC